MSYNFMFVKLVDGKSVDVIPQELQEYSLPFPQEKEWNEDFRKHGHGPINSAWIDKSCEWRRNNRNPKYRGDLEVSNMANGNFADFMTEVLDPVGQFGREHNMPADLAISHLEMWLEEYSYPTWLDNMSEDERSEVMNGADRTPYLSVRAQKLLEVLRKVKEEFHCTHLAWG